MTFNKAGVEGAGILGVKKGFLQFCIRPKKESTIYLNHPVFPAFLDDLTENANTNQEPLRCPLIHLKPVGGEQEAVLNKAWLQAAENHSLDVSAVAVTNHHGDPKSRPHFKGREYPDHSLLAPNECRDLVGLKFMDEKTLEHPIVEPFCISRG